LNPKELIAFAPRLYHMAEPETWESIKKYGLLSTSALLDKFEVAGKPRFDIESSHRPNSVEIKHSQYGTINIRDQKPMSESALLKCLNKSTPRKWYETLNGRVFFWLSEERLVRLLRARAYRKKKHCVLTVDTKGIVEEHYKNISLSPINSGATVYRPQPRGKETFLPIEEYPFDFWMKKRNKKDPIAELTVDYEVADIQRHVIEVRHMKDGKLVERIWHRK
jgi:hypothetical protein